MGEKGQGTSRGEGTGKGWERRGREGWVRRDRGAMGEKGLGVVGETGHTGAGLGPFRFLLLVEMKGWR